MSLLFVHEGERLKEDERGRLYTDGSYDRSAWDRYLSISKDLTVMFRRDARVFSPEDAQAKWQPFPEEEISFVPLEDTKSSLRSFLDPSVRRRTRRRVEDLCSNHDRAIIRLPGSAGYEAVTAARRKGIPYMIEVVGCPWDALWNHSLAGKILAPFEAFRLKRAARNAPFVLYVTDRFLQRRYPSSGRSIGCSDVVLEKSDPDALARRMKRILGRASGEVLVLGTAAAVDVRYKGHATVIHALSRLRSRGIRCVYKIAGQGNPDRLKSIARRLGVGDYVRFLGPVPRTRMADYYDSLDLYIQPSRQEGLPRALVEAMSRGCPALGTRVGGIPELLTKEMLFSARSDRELTERIIQLGISGLADAARRNYEFVDRYSAGRLDSRRRDFFREFSIA